MMGLMRRSVLQPLAAQPRVLAPVSLSLLLAWVASMIALPILLWTVGPGALPWAASVTVILQLGCVLSILTQAWAPLALVRTAATVMAAAWLVEWAGSTGGLLFGEYDYTNLFRPQLAGVPLLIPLAWLMMLPPAWAVAQILTRRTSGFAFLVVSALAFTAWDFFLDPQMVAWGAWVWPQGGSYFGIPWHNFAGWLAVTVLLTSVARPQPLPVRPLLVVYTVTWLLQTIGLGVFWRSPGPALVGFLVMGAFVIRCWQTLRSAPEATQSPSAGR